MKNFLIKHVGNMGDMVFLIPPVLATLKRLYPNCHITFVTAWGFKQKKRWLASRSLGEGWGQRNQAGFCVSLMLTNPHIDQLVHWHDHKTSLAGDICQEEGVRIPTWSQAYFKQKIQSGDYDGVYELDMGLKVTDNPIKKMYDAIGLPHESYTNYRLHFSAQDKKIAAEIMAAAPRPRIFLLEGLEGTTTRGWDPGKIPQLEKAIQHQYGTRPIWFGGRYTPDYQGRPLTLRENIALLLHGDIGIGVLSGPLHFAAAAGLPTLTLYADHPLHRAAPAYFLNRYIEQPHRQHRTLLGPAEIIEANMRLLKTTRPQHLTAAETKIQNYKSWNQPGRQSTKSSLAVITVDEIMRVVQDMLQ